MNTLTTSPSSFQPAIHLDHESIKSMMMNVLEQFLIPLARHNYGSTSDTIADSRQQWQGILNDHGTGHKTRCLVKKGKHYEFIQVEDIVFIDSDDSVTFLYTANQTRHMYTKSLMQMMNELDHNTFFQINRKQIININAIRKVHPYLNQRLKVELNTPTKEKEFIVARNKMSQFKTWIDS